MEENDLDVVSKLIQRYNAGKSLNAADGKHLHVENELPGAVSDHLAGNETKENAQNEMAILRAEEDRERQRTAAFLEKQRQANMKEQNGAVRDKVDYSIMQSEINIQNAQKSTLSITSTIARCSKLILKLDNKSEAAISIPCIDNEPVEDFQSSIQKLVRIFRMRRVATTAMQRVAPLKTKTQQNRETFVREVAGHLRSTTKAKTWLEWELDKNFDIFCNQVRDYETKQNSLRWLECEDRAWAHAKALMEEQRTPSGALTFTQARAILVDDFRISLQNDGLMNLLKSSENGSISRAQQIFADYKRLAGPAGCSKSNNATQESLHNGAEQKIASLQKSLEEEVRLDEVENEEQFAALALKRTVNQAWKQRFADMMKTLDEKDLDKRRLEKRIFISRYIRKAQAVYNLGSNKFARVLQTYSPTLVNNGCSGQLKRFWNNLLVSGTVLDQLVKDCEYFVLTHYSKKIQKQWRTVRIRRHFEAVVSRSRYLTSLTQKGKLWKTQSGFSHSITGRTQMQKFRTAMKGQRVPGLMEWDREFAHTSTLTNDFASVRTLQNRIVELKSGKSQESSSIRSAGSDLFNERHPQAAKWSFQSHYYEFVSTSASRIQRFWRAVCKRRAFFVSIRYAAAFCILRWMLHKIKGQVGRASGGLHSLHVTANYTHEAAHLAHLIYEKNSLRYQLEGTMLIQNSRAYLANDLRILKAIQEYQSGARLRTAREAIAASDGLRLVANQESAQAEQKLNAMIQVEAIRLMPRPEIPIESVSHPVGPEADRRHVFLLPNKAAARQHKEYQRKLYQWNNLQIASEGQAGLPMEQKLAATALEMQLRAKKKEFNVES